MYLAFSENLYRRLANANGKGSNCIRKEKDYKVFQPNSATFSVEFTDPSPITGENRYYLRVEQNDGNMGWTSPVWVTYKPAL